MNTKEELRRKHNMKLYPFYAMLSYDLLFYYAIRMLFLNEIKGLSASQIVLGSTIYAIISIIIQIPITMLVYRYGKKKMMIVGDLFMVIASGILFFINSMFIFLIYQLCISIGQGIKRITESNLLTQSIPKSKFQNEIFIRIDKKGYGRYFILSAITAIIAGYLYRINPYIPIFCTFIISVISLFIAFSFYDFEKITDAKVHKEEKRYIKDLKSTMTFVINSKRLRALFLYSSTIWAIIVLISTYKMTLLQDLGASATFIGYAYAIFELLDGFGAKIALKFNEIFRKYSLFITLFLISTTCIVIGIVSNISLIFLVKMLLVMILLCNLAIIKGIAQIISRKYLNSFTNNKVLPSIYSVELIINNFGRMVVTFLGSILLLKFSIIYAFIILGVIILALAFLISIYAKDKLGLSPDEYTDKDIFERKDFIF